MSYNITSFKLKKMNDLIIPLDALKNKERPDWSAKDPVLLDPLLSKVRIEMGCGQWIEGIIPTSSGKVAVTNLELAGEGSGSLMHYLMEDALKKSTGYLEAILVWEGGEIERLVVLDGHLSQATVEL
jgi:hypothetical protein